MLEMNAQLFVAAGIIAAAFIIRFLWRARGRYGRTRPNSSVAEAFEGFRVDPDLNYYSSGSDVYPNAILGIEKTWKLESDLWKNRKLNSRNMKELVQNMQSSASETNSMLDGFDIADNRGRRIGNGYSIWGLTLVVEVTGENKVFVSTPPQGIYQHS